MDGFIKKPKQWNNITFNYTNLYKKNNSLVSNINYDVLFILAGGFNQQGEINEWVKRRLDYAIEIYNNNPTKIKYIVCLGGGTYHKPPVSTLEGYTIHESTALVKYLLDNNIPKNILMREWFSYDTIANGYYSYINYSKIRNWKNIMVITSDFHIKRTKLIFEWIYSLEKDEKYIFNFIGVSDEGLNKEIIKIRTKREKNSINNLKKIINRINTLEKFHIWFHTEHDCYNCNFNSKELIKNNEKQSY